MIQGVIKTSECNITNFIKGQMYYYLPDNLTKEIRQRYGASLNVNISKDIIQTINLQETRTFDLIYLYSY